MAENTDPTGLEFDTVDLLYIQIQGWTSMVLECLRCSWFVLHPNPRLHGCCIIRLCELRWPCWTCSPYFTVQAQALNQPNSCEGAVRPGLPTSGLQLDTKPVRFLGQQQGIATDGKHRILLVKPDMTEIGLYFLRPATTLYIRRQNVPECSAISAERHSIDGLEISV